MEYNKGHPDSPSVMALDPSGLTNWINLMTTVSLSGIYRVEYP